jgi:hypothetical protein
MPKKRKPRKATARKTKQSATPIKRKRRSVSKKVFAFASPKKRRRKSMKKSSRHRSSVKRSSGFGGVRSSGILNVAIKGAVAGVGVWAIFAGTGKIAKMLNISDTNKTLLRIGGLGAALLLLPKVFPKQRQHIETAATVGIAFLALTFVDKMIGTGVLAGEDEYSPDDIQARLIAQNLDVQGYLPSSSLLGESNFMVDGLMEGGLMEGYAEDSLY